MNPQNFHVIGFDDGAFQMESNDPVLVAGAVCSGSRLDGVISTHITRDGDDATQALIDVLRRSRYTPQVHAVMLQGLTFGGFNVVDLVALHRAIDKPVVAATRNAPDMTAIERALHGKIANGAAKWERLARAPRAAAIAGLSVQAIGIDQKDLAALLLATRGTGDLPEPLRLAHMIASGISSGESRQRP